jgi:hypothetical protein
MEQALTVDDLRRAHVAFARVLQLVGWHGLGGSVLLAMAACLAIQSSHSHAQLVRDRDARAASGPTIQPASAIAVVSTPKLPTTHDVPLLLKRIERAAVGNDLPWAAADYRVVAAAGDSPASVEVRFAMTAPYPRLRAAVAELLDVAPAVTFRELQFSRRAVTAPDVDGKFVVVVFLAEEPGTIAVVAAGSAR